MGRDKNLQVGNTARLKKGRVVLETPTVTVRVGVSSDQGSKDPVVVNVRVSGDNPLALAAGLAKRGVYQDGGYSLVSAEGTAFVEKLAGDFIAHPEKAEGFYQSIGMLQKNGKLSKHFGG